MSGPFSVESMSWGVSRILSRTVIYLGPALPHGLVRPTRNVAGGQPCSCLVLLLKGFT